MTPELAATLPDQSWQDQLRTAVRDPAELCRLLELPPETVTDLNAGDGFPLLVPHAFIRRMRMRDPLDPLLLQVLPTTLEQARPAGYGPDPLAEHGLAEHGAIRKYPGRALLITTGACPIHCRYCFRREFPYGEQTATASKRIAALAKLGVRPDIDEIILSGGDPLTLSNGRLRQLIESIEALSHVNTVRIHSRFPIVLPARVDAGLIEALSQTRLRVVIVVHVNHPAEIDEAVTRAMTELRACSHLLLNQSVLLRGINDQADILIDLSKRLFAIGISPYYLHMLDRVAGSAHFDVPEPEAVRLVTAVRQGLPGYLVPKLVRDVPDELSKTPLPTTV